jgi:Flp pilus assembly protein TadB
MAARMTTFEQQRATTEPRTSAGAGWMVGPMAMLTLAIICGAASLALTVFGVWPAVVLVVLCAALAAYAVSKIRKHEPRSQR